MIFDLDDTLYKEVDYLVSAYRKIESALGFPVADEMIEWWKGNKNAFKCLIEKYDIAMNISQMLDIYRYHEPNITLTSDASLLLEVLRSANVKIGILSDGRSITQRNKIKALGLDWIQDVVISEEFGSEKPCEANYLYFMDKYLGFRYTYIADNINKDFIAPNRLGWQTICLKDDGRNIHKQNIEDVSLGCLPNYTVKSLQELL